MPYIPEHEERAFYFYFFFLFIDFDWRFELDSWFTQIGTIFFPF